jgi:uncharacterized protein
MSTTENKKMIRDAFDAWSRGDGRAFFKLVADDVQWTVIGATPISGTYHSKREFRPVVKSLSERLVTDLKVVPRDVIADGDKVAVQFESHAAGKNGTAYNQTYCWMLRMSDGQVREVVAYLDTEMVTKLFAFGTSSVSQPTNTARGRSLSYSRSRKFAKPTIALPPLLPRRRIDLGSA